MRVADWLDRVTADAERRGLTELVPLLQTLARSTEALRAADAEFGHPAAEQAVTKERATEYTERMESEAVEHAEDADDGSH